MIATHKDGTQVVLGSTQTVLPSFGSSQPQPVQVSWVWPMLEPPHRTTSVNLFTDDSLAASVAGGRLDRLLATVEDVVAQDPRFSMTLLVDPDGCEIGTIAGPAEWASDDAIKMIKAALGQG